jgi:hypothetical protein
MIGGRINGGSNYGAGLPGHTGGAGSKRKPLGQHEARYAPDWGNIHAATFRASHPNINSNNTINNNTINSNTINSNTTNTTNIINPALPKRRSVGSFEVRRQISI